MNHIPLALILIRLVFGIILIPLSLSQISYYRSIAIGLLIAGLLTDIFDGIIARRLDISTPKLRRMDSTVDQIFFISFAIAAYIQCPEFFKDNIFKLTILLGTEALAYLVCFVKFRKEIATHSIGAKLWTLLLVATLVQITVQCNSNILFSICFWAGVATRLEIIAIILLLPKWTTDVPSFYHAMASRNGKEIRRNKMFNG